MIGKRKELAKLWPSDKEYSGKSRREHEVAWAQTLSCLKLFPALCLVCLVLASGSSAEHVYG